MKEFKTLKLLSSLKTGEDFKLKYDDLTVYTKTNMSVNNKFVCYSNRSNDATTEVEMGEWVYVADSHDPKDECSVGA